MVSSPVVVGDQVWFQPAAGEGMILERGPRRNRVSRHDPTDPKREQVIAANLDVVVVVQSAAKPAFDPLQADRSMVLAGEIGAILVVNKTDLEAPQQSWTEPYRALGIPCLFVSAVRGDGLSELKEQIRGKTALFLGPSGVGKTSLMNALIPGWNRRVGELSRRTGEGRHTTTVSEMAVGEGFRGIDAPGMERITLWGVTRANLRNFFPEFRRFSCRFGDCVHTREPGCAVREEVGKGVATTRYESYLRILQEVQSLSPRYRREGNRIVPRRQGSLREELEL